MLRFELIKLSIIYSLFSFFCIDIAFLMFQAYVKCGTKYMNEEMKEKADESSLYPMLRPACIARASAL